MITRKTLVLLICTSILLAACDKVRRNKLTFDLVVIDKDANEPIDALVKLTYTETQGFGSSEEELSLGSTTNGLMHVDHKFKRKQGGFRVQVFPYAYTLQGTVGKPVYDAPVSNGELVKVYVQPLYHLRFKLMNTNCTDPSDSVWIEAHYNQIQGSPIEMGVTGCDVTFIPENFPGDNGMTWREPDITLQVHSFKSGMEETFVVYKELSAGEITTIYINY